ncbi:hypothetical protein [Hydrogenophaga soli]
MSNPICVADLSHLSPEEQPRSFQALYDVVVPLCNEGQRPSGTQPASQNPKFMAFVAALTRYLPTQQQLDAAISKGTPLPQSDGHDDGKTLWLNDPIDDLSDLESPAWPMDPPGDNELLPVVLNVMVHEASRHGLSVLSDSLGLGYLANGTALCAWGDPEEQRVMFSRPKLPPLMQAAEKANSTAAVPKQQKSKLSINFRALFFGLCAAFVAYMVFSISADEAAEGKSIIKAGKVFQVIEVTEMERKRHKGNISYSGKFTFRNENSELVSIKTTFPEEILKDMESGKLSVIYAPSIANNRLVFVGHEDEATSGSFIVSALAWFMAVVSFVFLMIAFKKKSE